MRTDYADGSSILLSLGGSWGKYQLSAAIRNYGDVFLGATSAADGRLLEKRQGEIVVSARKGLPMLAPHRIGPNRLGSKHRIALSSASILRKREFLSACVCNRFRVRRIYKVDLSDVWVWWFEWARLRGAR